MADTKATLVRREAPDEQSDLEFKRDLPRKLNGVIKNGRVEWVTEFTLATGVTSTTVSDERVTPDCQISLEPLTAEAAALIGKIYIPSSGLSAAVPWSSNPAGAFVVQHPALVPGTVASFRSSTKG